MEPTAQRVYDPALLTKPVVLCLCSHVCYRISEVTEAQPGLDKAVTDTTQPIQVFQTENNEIKLVAWLCACSMGTTTFPELLPSNSHTHPATSSRAE